MFQDLNQSFANLKYDTDDIPLDKVPQQDISSVTVVMKEEEQQSNDNSPVQEKVRDTVLLCSTATQMKLI